MLKFKQKQRETDEKASSPSKERTTTPVDPKLQHSSSETTTEQCSLSQIDSDGQSTNSDIMVKKIENLYTNNSSEPEESLSHKPETKRKLSLHIDNSLKSEKALLPPKSETSAIVDPEMQQSSSKTIAEQLVPTFKNVSFYREPSKSDIVVKQSKPLTIDNSKSEKLLSHGIKEQKTCSSVPELRQFPLEASNQPSNRMKFNRNVCECLSHIMEEQPNISRRTATLGLLPLDEQQLCLLKIIEHLSSSQRNLFQAFLHSASCLEAAVSNSPVKIESNMSASKSSVKLSSTKSSTESLSERSDVTVIRSQAKSIPDYNLQSQHKKPEDFDLTKKNTMGCLSNFYILLFINIIFYSAFVVLIIYFYLHLLK